MAILISVDGTTREVQPKDGVAFELDEMYALVETDIVQYVQVDDKVLIICEEGKNRDKPRNEVATELALSHTGYFPRLHRGNSSVLHADRSFVMEDCMIEQPEPAEPAFGWPGVCPACGAREPADCECAEELELEAA